MLDESLNNLKRRIEEQFGRKITYQKDCNALSSNIFSHTGEQISPATLRRVFGFLATNSQPSRVTLDILAQYIGATGWDNFLQLENHKPTLIFPVKEIWEKARLQAQIISLQTFEQQRYINGLSLSSSVLRNGLNDKLSLFLKSDYASTAIVGPGGYGKSYLMASWFSYLHNKRNCNNDIVLYVPVKTLLHNANAETSFSQWVQSLLGVPEATNLLDYLAQNPDEALGNLILLVDGLEEATSNSTKQEKIFEGLHHFASKGKALAKFKLIVASRLSTWLDFIGTIEAEKRTWLGVEDIDFDAYGSNIPPLTSNEIQHILDNTINQTYEQRVLIDELTPEIQATIAHPYLLQLFISDFQPATSTNDQLELFKEYLKKQIYFASNSDEKADIVNTIVESTSYGKKGLGIPKNELRKHFPIHLKNAGNYFAAYEELLSFGFLIEESKEGTFGSFYKEVKISPKKLFEVLIAQRLVENNGGFSNDLLTKVEELYKNHPLQKSIIALIYELAYKEQESDTLKSLFSLNSSTIDQLFEQPNIVVLLRKQESLRNVLVPSYARNKQARKVFERYPDMNSLTTILPEMIQTYLRYSESDADKLYAHSLLAMSSGFSLNQKELDEHCQQIAKLQPTQNSNIGTTISALLLHQFLDGSKYNSLIDSLWNDLVNCSSASAILDASKFILPTLVLTNDLQRIDSTEHICNKLLKNPDAHRLNKELSVYFMYRKALNCNSCTLKDIRDIEDSFAMLSPWNSYLPKITGHMSLATIYLQNNMVEQAYNCYRSAAELSHLAEYTGMELKLLKAITQFLCAIGEERRTNDFTELINEISAKTGVPNNIFK
ncbi:MAG: NACHT domain-containing protein [Bacteroidales bacterium]|nr:NACHT domain-containing protein [Bacteroidales bacterium]MBN2750172.1 NACHT domain-containing protein [Bacteroidales bacterium]